MKLDSLLALPLAVCLGSALLMPVAAFGADPAAKCATSKHKAAAKKLGAMLKCHDVAILKGTTVDAACLDKAETRFNEAFAKAEAKGGCTSTGTTAADQIIDDAVADLLAALPQGPTAEDCNNSVDDDADSQGDCRDQDCALEPKCTDSGTGESGNLECSNNIDDDSDGFADCLDFQCQPFTFCGGWNNAD